WDAAAGLLLAGTTAVHTVVAAEVRDGETVLVHGGSGGVGLMAVQLAAARGARVIATARPSAHELLRELGAEPVTYGPGLVDRVRSLSPGVDAAIDTVGTDEALDSSIELGVHPQRIASIAAFERGGRLGVRLLGSGPGAEPGDDLRLAARRQLVEDTAAGRLRVVVAATFPLAAVAEAHRVLTGSHAPGKIVLTV
ncbi:MAG TPA: zinc-binding dehydrogenase, partial [Angustibacter sp.]|nr:zinc-binding dehydrogenase [Angustibacter sp.]